MKKCFATLLMGIFLFPASLKSQDYEPPVFNDGNRAFHKYWATYSVYIPLNEMFDEDGKIISPDYTAIIHFGKKGDVKFVNVLGKNGEVKKHIKRVLTLITDWKPAKRNGQPLDTFITQKVCFSSQVSRKGTDSTILETIYRIIEGESETVYLESEFARKSNSTFMGKTYRIVDEEPLPLYLEVEAKRKLKKQRLDKERASKYYDRGVKISALNKYDSALTCFNVARESGGGSPELFYNLGVCYLKTGHQPVALENFREAALRGDEDAFLLYLKLRREAAQSSGDSR